MQTTNYPKWWTQEHEGAWSRIREAMRRDWEQTKYDFELGGKPLDQDASDTIKQVASKEPIPPGASPTPTPATAGTTSRVRSPTATARA